MSSNIFNQVMKTIFRCLYCYCSCSVAVILLLLLLVVVIVVIVVVVVIIVTAALPCYKLLIVFFLYYLITKRGSLN